MNKDINIVLTSAETVLTAVGFTAGLGRVQKGSDAIYTFPWKKLGAVSKSESSAGAAGQYTITPGLLAADTDYSFYLTQVVSGKIITERITFTSGATAPATADVVCDAWRVVINAHVNSGRLAVTAGGTTTLTLLASSVDNYNLTAQEISLAGIVQNQAPIAPVGRGADLLAEGIVDAFPDFGLPATLPLAGVSYSEYTFELMAPKGNGGFNEQTSDQAVLLKVYADESDAVNWALLDGVIDTIIDGSITASGLLGSDV